VTVPTGVVSGASVSHRRASVDTIERASVESDARGVETLLAQPGVREAFVLQTCNRAEAYVVTDDAAAGREALTRYTAGIDPDAVRELGHEASLEHLLRVACGLESLVLGEDQILGQVRRALVTAREAGGIGPVLEDALTKALHVGERARTETRINEGVVSLGSAAVRLAEREFGDLTDARALVVGAGEMGTLAAKALDGEVATLVVANRSVERAEHVARGVTAEATGLDTLEERVTAADLVLTATGSDGHVLDRSALTDAGETFVVDLAQPRDVEPAAAGLDDVAVRDLDALESVTEETQAERADAAEAVEAMIADELSHLLAQYKRKRADQVIAAMYEGAERVKSREVGKALSELDDGEGVSAEQEAVIESLADALVNQLLSAPTKSLREAAEEGDWSTINSALELFGPGMRVQVDEDPGPPEGFDMGDLALDDVPPEAREEMPSAVREQLTGGSD
jgi:glutamyl-tRNA reductase